MRIAVDAMGGDHAPEAVVRGAAQAARHWGLPVTLVGERSQIARCLQEAGAQEGPQIAVVDAPEVIGMAEHPVEAVRKKRRASLVVAAELVASGEADAVVSAGSTGAAMAASLLRIGRVRGVDRVPIAVPIPAPAGPVVLLDAGANVDCRPDHLVQFAGMGAAYARSVLGIRQARVALLSVGEEETKGNAVVLEAHARLARLKEALPFRFVGNAEGRDLFSGQVDVLVCDGFVGNAVLKAVEGVAQGLFQALRAEASRGLRARLGGLLLYPNLKGVRSRYDYREHGGAPLLGLKGVSVIAHGRSDERAIAMAVRAAANAVTGGVVLAIQQYISDLEGEGD